MENQIFIVQIARPIEKMEKEIYELVVGIGFGYVLSIILLIAISQFMAGRILKPIREMNQLAQTISGKNMDQRILLGDEHDEFTEHALSINRMLDRLQNSFIRQRSFLFDTSHELKTPLTTMRLAVDEICTLNEESLPPTVKDSLLRLSNQVLRMERLVKDLLKLSTLETMDCINPAPVEIRKMLLSLAEEYRFLAEGNNITMTSTLPEQLTIMGDGEKLQRAFSNILDNAVKYNEDGGRIELTGELSETGLTVTISNTGPVVAESEIPHLFDQFYRAEKSRSTQHGGSGLGLAIVKKIIEIHGGTVTFKSGSDGWNHLSVFIPATTGR